jgi:phage tail sheath protein FI
MSSVSFHYGTRVFQSGEIPVPVRTAQTAIISLIGTAPDAYDVKFPLNKPILILRPSDAEGLVADGALTEAINSIFDQVGCPIILVRVEEGATTPETWANAVGSQVAFSGVHAFRRASPAADAPRLFHRPLRPSSRARRAGFRPAAVRGRSAFGRRRITASGSHGET